MKNVVHEKQSELKIYTLKNEQIEVRALNYGATIISIKTRNRHGEMENVLVEYQNIYDYFDVPDPYLNAIVGPVAGRIAYGEYILEGEKQKLSINNGVNHLHGGKSGISKQFFTVEEVGKSGLHFYKECSHEEDGYRGKFIYHIYYCLKENTLQVEINCFPSQKTIINMASHMYFNLSGEMKESIDQHFLTLPSKHKLKIHKDGFPYEIEEIELNSAFDFSCGKQIKANFMKGSKEFELTLGYDTPFLLDLGKEICLEDKKSGRKLIIKTDQKSVVVYTANYFNEDMKLNGGRMAYPFCCIALETQDVPNGVNIQGLEQSSIYDEKHPYRQSTSYTFFVDKE